MVLLVIDPQYQLWQTTAREILVHAALSCHLRSRQDYLIEDLYHPTANILRPPHQPDPQRPTHRPRGQLTFEASTLSTSIQQPPFLPVTPPPQIMKGHTTGGKHMLEVWGKVGIRCRASPGGTPRDRGTQRKAFRTVMKGSEILGMIHPPESHDTISRLHRQ